MWNGIATRHAIPSTRNFSWMAAPSWSASRIPRFMNFAKTPTGILPIAKPAYIAAEYLRERLEEEDDQHDLYDVPARTRRSARSPASASSRSSSIKFFVRNFCYASESDSSIFSCADGFVCVDEAVCVVDVVCGRENFAGSKSSPQSRHSQYSASSSCAISWRREVLALGCIDDLRHCGVLLSEVYHSSSYIISARTKFAWLHLHSRLMR